MAIDAETVLDRRRLKRRVTFWRIAGLQPMPGLTLRTAASPRLPYALPISAGTVAALWFR